MKLVLKMAWKNILAYKKRTIITIILTVCMTGLLVFTTAFMEGSHETMIRSGVEIYPGYIQVTSRQYRDSPGLENLIFDVAEATEVLSTTKEIKTFGRRFETFVLLSHGDKSIGSLFTSIEPDKEQHLSRLKSSLVKGQYLSSGDHAQVYMGAELAKRLKVDVGSTISFIGTGADYSFSADNITVKGLFKTGLFEFDANGAFVTRKYMDEVMATENMASHIVILPKEKENSLALSQLLGKKLGKDYLVEDWSIRLSALVKAMEVDSIFGYITLGIIFLVILFVVMIYTFLSIFARVRTIGILRAIGTTPEQITLSLLLESAILAGISVIIGGIIGGAFALYFQINPIDYGQYEEQFKQYGLAASAMPALFSPPLILRDALIMFFVSTCSTLFPILRVTRLEPVEAIRHV